MKLWRIEFTAACGNWAMRGCVEVVWAETLEKAEQIVVSTAPEGATRYIYEARRIA